MFVKNIRCLLLFTTLIYFNLAFAQEKSIFIKKTEFGSETDKNYLFFQLRNVKTDNKGNVFVLDSLSCLIKKFDSEFRLVKETGSKGQGPGEFDTPASMDIDSNGNVYIYDSGRRTISVFNNDLNFIKSILPERAELFYKIFLTNSNNIILVKNAMVQGENYFYEISPDGKKIRSFFGIFHELAPKMKGLEEIGNFSRYILYYMSASNINPGRDQLVFTHLVPEDPLKVYIIDINSGNHKTIKYKLPDYNAGEYFNLTKQGKNKPDPKYPHIQNVFLTEKGLIIVQRRIDEVKENRLSSVFAADIFFPDGRILKEGLVIDKILDIDSNNNIYCEKDENGTIKLVIYKLND